MAVVEVPMALATVGSGSDGLAAVVALAATKPASGCRAGEVAWAGIGCGVVGCSGGSGLALVVAG